MKKSVLKALTLAVVGVLVGCSKKDDNSQLQLNNEQNGTLNQEKEKPQTPRQEGENPQTPKQEEKPQVLKEFKIDKDRVSVSEKGNVQLTIVSGNGNYQLTQPEPTQQIVRASINGSQILIEGLKWGVAEIVVTDVQSTRSQKVKIVVNGLEESDLQLHGTYTTAQEYLTQTKITLQKYREAKADLEKYPELPNELFNYKGQKSTIDEFKLAEAYAKNYLTHTEATNIEELKSNYENLYQYGYAFARIELMARRCEAFRKQYGHLNPKIEELCKDFDGQYASQEGKDFFIGLNDAYVKPYNEIIKWINELNSK